MIQRGIGKESIYPIGIPVDPKFEIQEDKKLCREELGLEDKPTILIMGGSLGLGDMAEIYETIIDSHLDVQIVAVTGNNAKLEEKLNAVDTKDKNTRIYGYVDNIEKIMSASDIILTKPGGITVAEAITKMIPIGIISPLPGQEIRNTNYLLNSGLAFMIFKEEHFNVAGIIENILRSEKRMEFMRLMAKEKRKLGSLEELVKIITK